MKPNRRKTKKPDLFKSADESGSKDGRRRRLVMRRRIESHLNDTCDSPRHDNNRETKLHILRDGDTSPSATASKNRDNKRRKSLLEELKDVEKYTKDDREDIEDEKNDDAEEDVSVDDDIDWTDVKPAKITSKNKKWKRVKKRKFNNVDDDESDDDVTLETMRTTSVSDEDTPQRRSTRTPSAVVRDFGDNRLKNMLRSRVKSGKGHVSIVENGDDDSPAPRRGRQQLEKDDSPAPRRARQQLEKDDSPAPRRARQQLEKDDSPAPRRARQQLEKDDSPAPRGRQRFEEDDSPAPRRARQQLEKDDSPAPRRARQQLEKDDSPAPRRGRQQLEKDDSPAPRRGRQQLEKDDSPAPRGCQRFEEDASPVPRLRKRSAFIELNENSDSETELYVPRKSVRRSSENSQSDRRMELRTGPSRGGGKSSSRRTELRTGPSSGGGSSSSRRTELRTGQSSGGGSSNSRRTELRNESGSRRKRNVARRKSTTTSGFRSNSSLVVARRAVKRKRSVDDESDDKNDDDSVNRGELREIVVYIDEFENNAILEPWDDVRSLSTRYFRVNEGLAGRVKSAECGRVRLSFEGRKSSRHVGADHDDGGGDSVVVKCEDDETIVRMEKEIPVTVKVETDEDEEKDVDDDEMKKLMEEAGVSLIEAERGGEEVADALKEPIQSSSLPESSSSVVDDNNESESTNRVSTVYEVSGDTLIPYVLLTIDAASTTREPLRELVSKLTEIAADTEIPERPLVCKICPSAVAEQTSFNTYESLVTHYETHANSALTCKQCSATYPTYFDMRAHMKSEHAMVAVADHAAVRTCLGCEDPILFASERDLAIHYTAHFERDLPFVCSICQLDVTSYGEFVDHMNSDHGLRNRRSHLRCLACPSAVRNIFDSVEELCTHYATRHFTRGDGDFNCRICNRGDAFKTYNELSRHMFENHDRVSRAAVRYRKCEKFCRQVVQLETDSDLALHYVAHCRGDLPFDCWFCDAESFSTMYDLQKHITDVHLTVRVIGDSPDKRTEDSPGERTAVSGENSAIVKTKEEENIEAGVVELNETADKTPVDITMNELITDGFVNADVAVCGAVPASATAPADAAVGDAVPAPATAPADAAVSDAVPAPATAPADAAVGDAVPTPATAPAVAAVSDAVPTPVTAPADAAVSDPVPAPATAPADVENIVGYIPDSLHQNTDVEMVVEGATVNADDVSIPVSDQIPLTAEVPLPSTAEVTLPSTAEVPLPSTAEVTPNFAAEEVNLPSTAEVPLSPIPEEAPLPDVNPKLSEPMDTTENINDKHPESMKEQTNVTTEPTERVVTTDTTPADGVTATLSLAEKLAEAIENGPRFEIVPARNYRSEKQVIYSQQTYLMTADDIVQFRSTILPASAAHTMTLSSQITGNTRLIVISRKDEDDGDEEQTRFVLLCTGERIPIVFSGNSLMSRRAEHMEYDPDRPRCPKCRRRFSRASSFVAHLKSETCYNRVEFTCPVCEREFPRKRLVVHVNENNCSKPLPPVTVTRADDACGYCRACVVTLTTDDDIRKHRCRGDAAARGVYRCPRCLAAFSTRTAVASHLISSSPCRLKSRLPRCNLATKYSPMKCFVCDESFNDERDFLSHKHVTAATRDDDASVTEDTTIDCSKCNCRFTTFKKLIQHERRKGKNLHRCSRCPRVYISIAQLKLHVYIAHAQIKLHNCARCSKYYKYGLQLRRHIRREHGRFRVSRAGGARRHRCPNCRKTFATATQKYTHDVFNGACGAFLCGACHRAFRTKAAFVYHNVHVHERALYRCATCSYRFVSERQLRRHRAASLCRERKKYQSRRGHRTSTK
ncbi:uncharacterized protein LOC141911512 [Tubulanus polymorphus]|uniref:uncharacterized protein LOC141911512 n=1 Tax=Tubulanus polymorphus TaxID=672921 RepID=UPI003DA3696D